LELFEAVKNGPRDGRDRFKMAALDSYGGDEHHRGMKTILFLALATLAHAEETLLLPDMPLHDPFIVAHGAVADLLPLHFEPAADERCRGPGHDGLQIEGSETLGETEASVCGAAGGLRPGRRVGSGGA